MAHYLSRTMANLDIGLSKFIVYRTRPQFAERLGRRVAERTYARTVARSSAYRKLVQSHFGHVPAAMSVDDFGSLPILDKNTYINQHPLEEICGEELINAFMIQRSSGYSGNPCYWPRRQGDTRNARKGFHFSCDHYFSPQREPVLFVVGFSLGTWVGGTDLFRASIDYAARTGRRLTTITPGENVAETLDILHRFGKAFARIVVAGNPVFLKALVDEGTKILWHKLPITFSTGGEGTTESWREWIAERLGVDIDQEPMRVFNGYGATDFGGAAATESPWSIAIKRQAIHNPDLAAALFGRTGNLPNLYQYSPLSQYFENHDGELLVTAWSHVPLVRYNIHDRGRAIPFRDVWQALIDYGVNVNELTARFGPPMRLPFLYVDTRSDGTVSIAGANVYPGNIETAILEHPELEQNVEHFWLVIAYDNQQNSVLTVELVISGLDQRSQRWCSQMVTNAEDAILQTLLRDNTEYAVTWQHNQRVRPQVKLMPVTGAEHAGIKRHYIRTYEEAGR